MSSGPVALDRIRSAASEIANQAVRTPLVLLELDGVDTRIYLKLENLQPIGSFKLRGALNALAERGSKSLRDGVVTASAGNMAQGVAWAARRRHVPCTVVVPEGAPETKRSAIVRLDAQIVEVPFERWWRAIEEARFDELEGVFIHPVQDESVIAGNATIGLEILEDLPEPDAILVPYGGGGLACGIASAVRHLAGATSVYAVEPATGAAFAGALEVGGPTEVEFERSFVDGAGARTVLPSMWPRASSLLDGAITVSLDQTAAAVRLLAERARVVAEGAGGLALAGALSERRETWKEVVVVVSGGNIDSAVFSEILRGRVPAV
jgi:threonine dehydratase